MKRLFAIGDIHGCFEQLRMMIEDKIKATMDDKIVFIGDYIDRGPEVKKVIDYIIDLQSGGFDIVTIRGNHEVMLLDSLDKNDMTSWLWNGAAQTLESFGIDSIEELTGKYRNFFESLPWYYETGNFLFVHAGFNDSEPFTDRQTMVWTRNEHYSNPILTTKTIIHGHTPISIDRCIENVRSGNHVINIDTGCVYEGPGYGNLTAVELNSREIFFVGRTK